SVSRSLSRHAGRDDRVRARRVRVRKGEQHGVRSGNARPGNFITRRTARENSQQRREHAAWNVADKNRERNARRENLWRERCDGASSTPLRVQYEIPRPDERK